MEMSHSAWELCRRLGDDGGLKAAYRGGCRACQNLSARAIRHGDTDQRRPTSSSRGHRRSPDRGAAQRRPRPARPSCRDGGGGLASARCRICGCRMDAPGSCGTATGQSGQSRLASARCHSHALASEIAVRAGLRTGFGSPRRSCRSGRGAPTAWMRCCRCCTCAASRPAPETGLRAPRRDLERPGQTQDLMTHM